MEEFARVIRDSGKQETKINWFDGLPTRAGMKGCKPIKALNGVCITRRMPVGVIKVFTGSFIHLCSYGGILVLTNVTVV
jgi:hypothetical protein